jgi:hypothetical protein
MLLARATAIPKLAGFAEPKLDGIRAIVTVGEPPRVVLGMVC